MILAFDEKCIFFLILNQNEFNLIKFSIKKPTTKMCKNKIKYFYPSREEELSQHDYKSNIIYDFAERPTPSVGPGFIAHFTWAETMQQSSSEGDI